MAGESARLITERQEVRPLPRRLSFAESAKRAGCLSLKQVEKVRVLPPQFPLKLLRFSQGDLRLDEDDLRRSSMAMMTTTLETTAFRTTAEILSLLRGFDDCTLPRERWTHV